jgi:hypothetical protein
VNGNAKSVTAEVIETLDQILDSGDLFVSRHVEESEGIARTLVDRGYGTILTGGGDGTFTVVVTAVVKEARRRNAPLPRFGLFRLGTGNSLAWVVGASGAGKAGRALAADLQRLRADAGSRSLRLVEAEGLYAPFCGFGVDAQALRDYNKVKSALARGPFKNVFVGPVAYAISASTSTVPGYLFRRTPHCRVINNGADAFRIGDKGKVLGAPIRKGAIVYEGPGHHRVRGHDPLLRLRPAHLPLRGGPAGPHAAPHLEHLAVGLHGPRARDLPRRVPGSLVDLRLLRRGHHDRDGPAHRLPDRRRRAGRSPLGARAPHRAHPHRGLLRAPAGLTGSIAGQ